MSGKTVVETSECVYERHDGDDGPEWWRRNRVYGEQTSDHMTPVLSYGGVELHAALDALAAARLKAEVESSTWGDLSDLHRQAFAPMQPHEWDNMSQREQRNYLLLVVLSLQSQLASAKAENEEQRRQIIAGVYDAASVGITLIDTNKLQSLSEDALRWRAVREEGWIEAMQLDDDSNERHGTAYRMRIAPPFLVFAALPTPDEYADALIREQAALEPDALRHAQQAEGGQ